ncbi:MbcA/ParS/Xre antitoxin family protein [Pseudomonas guineae]|uniref:MbcA/ParS/Xre antitoxin family protein n=1 Tax=Pseudomonas guineae TaxID=425504 RepID=UPI003CFDB714
MKKVEQLLIEQRAHALFGCGLKAERWLSSPKQAFSGLSPREAMERGRSAEVIHLIVQAEHGFVF